jgi:hypothetical protein
LKKLLNYLEICLCHNWSAVVSARVLSELAVPLNIISIVRAWLPL